MITPRASVFWLLIGDALAALVVTLIGFWSHYGEIRGGRWLTTFLPVLVAWLAIAPWMGVYRPEVFRDARRLWLPALAALLSAPLAASLRGLWLNAAIAPVFVAVMAGTNALGFLVWRGLWVLAAPKIEQLERRTWMNLH